MYVLGFVGVGMDAECYLRLFFFNDTATTEIYTLSLHDALPISDAPAWNVVSTTRSRSSVPTWSRCSPANTDRKSTRLNSSHVEISYAVFCLKKKKTPQCRRRPRRPTNPTRKQNPTGPDHSPRPP